MIEIKTGITKEATVSVPGSKSYTHRLLIAAAIANGRSIIENPLKSEDTLITRDCLMQMGVAIEDQEKAFTVHGNAARFKVPERPLDLRNSGTSMRLLAAVAALVPGPVTLTGTRRMQERPIQNLLDALQQMGATARSLSGNGCPPVEISGSRLKGGRVSIDCHVSSQFLSALLLVAPFAEEDSEIVVTNGLVSKPYVDMTLDTMERFGVSVERQGYERFLVKNGQAYRSGTYRVESDCSQAGYFWAAAAVTGAGIKVTGTSLASRQGDVRLTDCLKQMGCRVVQEQDGIRVSGGRLNGITVDMADMPDVVPTLAVVAAFAQGLTVIKNVAHLRAKECDRMSAVATELAKMGIEVDCRADQMRIAGGCPKGAVIDTYDDHRMAMSFAVAGLKVSGVKIKDETCVGKSFPDFWSVLDELCRAE